MLKSYPRGSKDSLSEHFYVSEFECHCGLCKHTWVETDLVNRLESLRKELGAAIFITSGFRCAGRQAALRDEGIETAKKVSQHELGASVDLICAGKSGIALAEAAKKVGFLAIGTAANWIHVDMRVGKVRSWGYTEK